MENPEVNNGISSISLYELCHRIKRVLAANFPNPIWVKAEIASLQIRREHRYFQLVEKDQQGEIIISKAFASLWAGNYTRLRRSRGEQINEVLKEGLEVLLLVKVTFHEEYGFNLQIQDIDPNFTIGKYFSRKQQIFNKILERKLDRVQSSLSLPYVLQRVAVISSSQAAGYKDFCRQLEEVSVQMDIRHRLFESSMQGKNVEKDLLAAFEEIQRSAMDFDAVAIIRGGGGKLDLADFDNLLLAEKLAALPLPVFTGIGHETDQSALDLVAFRSLKTPTATAQFIIDHNLSFLKRLAVARDTLTSTVYQVLVYAQNHLTALRRDLFNSSRQPLLQQGYQLTQISESLKTNSRYQLRESLHRLKSLETELKLSDPITILERGFSITAKNGKVVKNEAEVKEQDELEVRLFRGKIKVVKI